MINREFLRQHRKTILLWSLILLIVVVALLSGVDKKVVVFGTLVVGMFTQAFTGLAALLVLIPWIGPLLVKILSLPFFWLLNALGYFVGVVAIKRGYGKEFASSRMVTMTLLAGIIIGYILGHLLPLR